MDVIRDDVRMRGLYERDIRKEAYDRGTTSKQYKKGEMVLLRMPGMHGRGKKTKVVHVNWLMIREWFW